MWNNVALPIFTKKNSKRYMCLEYPYSTRWDRDLQSFILMELDPFLLYYDQEETGSE